MENNSFGGDTNIGFSEASEMSVSENTETSYDVGEETDTSFIKGTDNAPDSGTENLDEYLGESDFEEVAEGDDDSWENLDKYLGESESEEIAEGDDDSWDDLDKYLGKSESEETAEGDDDGWEDLDKYFGDGEQGKDGQDGKENTDGEYTVEVTYLADSDEDEREIPDTMEKAYNETSSPQELKGRITEVNDDIEVVDAHVVNRPEAAEPYAELEKSPEISEQFAETGEQPSDTQEQSSETQEKPVETREQPAETGEKPADTQEQPEETSETPAEAEEKPEMSGERAYALSFESISSAEKLNKQFEESYYTQEKYNMEEMGSIQADSIRLRNEIEIERDYLETAIRSKHDEIYEYVTEGNMSRLEIERDQHYQSMVGEYKAYQAQQNQLKYFSGKLEDNSSRLSEITGKSDDEILAEYAEKENETGFYGEESDKQNRDVFEADREINEEIDNTENTESEDIREAYENHNLKDIDEKIAISYRNSDELEWEGERGNSMRVPKDPEGELAAELRKYGVEGIEYKQGDVDFGSVAVYEVEFTNQDELYYSIGGNIPIGKLETRQDFNAAVREKWQSIAKQQVVERIAQDKEYAAELQEKTGIGVSKVTSESALKKELSRVGLTMHEAPDCSKIQFVPTSIHDAFKHSGGTSEMLERQLSADVRRRVEYNRDNKKW